MTGHLSAFPAKLTTCHRCGQITLTAVTGGLTTTVTVSPLTLTQEITELLTGKPTFDLVPHGRRLFLEWRDICRIRAGRLHPVVAAHGCTGARQEPVPPIPAEELPDDPPF